MRTASHDTGADTTSAKLADCDESLSTIAADVAGLLDDLERLRAIAGQLADRHSEQEAAFARQQLELASLQDERSLVGRRADELREAERRLAESDGRVASLAQELVALRAAVAERDVQGREIEPSIGHVRFLTYPDGYRLTSSDERCARAGDVVDVEGRWFLVTRVGRSPLPDDRRPCAFLTPDTSAA
jgi:hypothetical protein